MMAPTDQQTPEFEALWSAYQVALAQLSREGYYNIPSRIPSDETWRAFVTSKAAVDTYEEAHDRTSAREKMLRSEYESEAH